jgi:hypothetical protein
MVQHSSLSRVLHRLCAFISTTGCLHGDSCDFAHDINELQPTPDLRKSTLCINYTRGYDLTSPCITLNRRRCAARDCRFAHGIHELRINHIVPGPNQTTCPMWSTGRCSLGAHCSLQHSFPESVSRVGLEAGDRVRSPSINTTVPQSSRKIISIDESLPRRRLDLFPHLDFSNELELDCDSLLSILSKELHKGAIDIPMVVDGDYNPWNLPH